MANQAAWIPAAKAPLEVKDTLMPKPEAGEVLLCNKVVAINPIDVKIQQYGVFIKEYPAILGFESAGVVEDVGEGVSKFKKGDRVTALSVGIRTGKASHTGFQNFMVAPENVVASIPDDLTFVNAAVLPLCLATAAAGLYQPEYLNLPLPSVTAVPSAGEKDKVILIWGGSSAVGSNAIQLCHAAGLYVLTTASPKNFDYVKDLGADQAFDHSDSDVIEKLVAAADGKKVVGVYDTISSESTAKASAAFLHHLGGGKIAATSALYPETLLLADVQRFFVQIPGSNSDGTPQPWMYVWNEFLQEGLKSGKLKAKPDPIVKEGGLGAVQGAMDFLRDDGVSAAKVVVTL